MSGTQQESGTTAAPSPPPAAPPSPPPAAPPSRRPPGPPPRRRRGGGSVRDIVLSLIVVGVVTGGWFLVSGLWQNVRVGFGRPAAPTVDVAASATAYAGRTTLPLLLGRDLPSGWTGRDARLVAGGTWHVGYLTPDGRFAGIDEVGGGPGGPIAVGELDQLLPHRSATGTVQLPTGRWTVYTADQTSEGLSRTGLVQPRGASTVIVSGTAGVADLRTLAGSLTAVGTPAAGAAPGVVLTPSAAPTTG